MLALPLLRVSLAAVSLLPGVITAIDPCPARCVDAGPNSGNWSVYPNLNIIKRCQQTMFYSFSLYDAVDDPDSTHRIAACASYGTDFTSMEPEPMTTLLQTASPVDVELELGWWYDGSGLVKSATQALVVQMREYIDNGHGPSDRPFILYGRSGQTTIGMYIGQGLLLQGVSASALRTFEDNFDMLDDNTSSLAMQLCGSGYDRTHTLGIFISSNTMFAPIQRAIKSWVNGECLSFIGSTNFPGKANFVTPLLNSNVVNDSTPDSRPKPEVDGSCFAYDVQENDNCSKLGAKFNLTNKEIENFNENTWGWSGCKLLYVNARICLSNGKAPFPAPIPNAACGPQKPGSIPPPDGSNISDMNPCPLNACCNVWGQCGVTVDFCIDTNTGPPGTAENGTYGCISNCGVDVVKGTGSGAIKLAYFQGYGMSRKCLYQDALQINTSEYGYTHLHFGFGTLTPTYEVKFGDALSAYQFHEFKRVQHAKRILSFGGWEFSTSPDTYYIFREGVKVSSRVKMATSIADFIEKHRLDGVDIDWEYPGAPDLPSFDPGKEEDSSNYLAFLAVLKDLLPGKIVSIAAPASYWYLKQFPIKKISDVVDYIVYMTYDLHGQWDAYNEYSQKNCPTGNCLRSHANLTETKQALAMMTKAGVPGNKIVVGLTSFGRSFQMAEAECWDPSCKFTGDRLTSYATPGRCTGTAGYLADAEIKEIMNNGGVVKSFLDTSSNSDVLVYDNTQWVGYLSESTKAVRTELYTSLGMAGTADWASDLHDFNPAPKPAKDWASFIAIAASGNDPKESNTSIGRWKDFNCMSDVVKDPYKDSPKARWKAVDADSAWREVVDKWFSTDKDQYLTFPMSLERTLKSGSLMGCETFNGQIDNCDRLIDCPHSADGDSSGPAAQFIWNSVITIHKMYHTYHENLLTLIGPFASGADDMENTFAPIPEEKTNEWLNILIDLLTIGSLGSAAPFFNGFLKSLPAFANPNTFDNIKDTVLMLMGQTTSLAKDMLSSPDQDTWTPSEQDKFSNYMNEVLFGWMNATEFTLGKLFGGEDTYVTVLGNLISDGKLIAGAREGKAPAVPTAGEVQANIFKTIYGYSIPALWRRSKTYAFVLDSGVGCDGNPLSKYVDDKTAEATSVCYDGTLYYLVNPHGDALICDCIPDPGSCRHWCHSNKFSAPVGLSRLGDFGKLSVADLVKGSVNTWRHNNKENKRLNFTNMALERSTQSNLLDTNIQTAGFVQLPVCSPDRAFQSWSTGKKGSSENYPCDIPPGKDYCGDSSFENHGSNTSPTVNDCRQIIKNIEGDASTEFTHRITGHREILKFGSCAFGIERTGDTGGAVMFKVGGQDVIDIINEAIKKFSGNGKVGAKGIISCLGTTAGTKVKVKWGIY